MSRVMTLTSRIVLPLFLIGSSLVSRDLSAQEPPSTEFTQQRSSRSEPLVIDDAVLKIYDELQIPCLTQGLIQMNQVQEGSLVKAGELVMEIDASLARLELEKLEQEWLMAKAEAASTVDLDYAKRTIEVAKAELGRALRSNQRSPGAVPTSEIDQLTLVVEKASAEQNKIQFQTELRTMLTQVRETDLKIGRQKLRDHQIHAPVSGMVVELFKKQGEWVQISEPVARLVRLDKLKSEVQVPAEVALSGLSERSAVFIPRLKKYQSRTYPAKIVFVQPLANPVNGTVRVWVEVENEDLSLIAGLMGRLEIAGDSTATATTTPTGQ